jgi:hypothetical protein
MAIVRRFQYLVSSINPNNLVPGPMQGYNIKRLATNPILDQYEIVKNSPLKAYFSFQSV